MQLHFLALLRLVVPVTLLVLACFFREYFGELSQEMRILINNMPYLTCIAAILMAVQFRRARMLLAAVGVAVLYWLIQNHLQVSLADSSARGVFVGVSIALPLLALFLLAVPERGIWNIHGLVSVAAFSILAIAAFYSPTWLPAVSTSLDAQILSRSSGGYLLPNVVTLMLMAVIFLALFLLCLRNNDSEAALAACLLALFLTLQFLHLDYISVALCTAAGLCLVYGLLLSSHAMAYRDDLTGLPGRRALNERLKSLVLPSFLWVKAKQWSRMWYKSLFLWRYSNERYRVVYSTFGAWRPMENHGYYPGSDRQINYPPDRLAKGNERRV